MKRKVIQHRWRKKLLALILVVFCLGTLAFMQTCYNHVAGLVSLQHHFVSEPEVLGPKIAFLFIARNRLPLEMIWDTFFRGGESKFSIFVHCRPGFILNKATTRSTYFLKRQVNNSVQVEWGEASMIEAERVLLRHALVDPLNDRFVFLSDSCIPLYNFSYTYDYIMSTSTSFVDSFADTKEGRYNPKMDPVIPVYNWRKGSQWAVLTRKHAEVVVEDETVFPMFQKYCMKKPLPEFWRAHYIPADTSKVHNCIPDEHYVQTLLAVWILFFLLLALFLCLGCVCIRYRLCVHYRERERSCRCYDSPVYDYCIYHIANPCQSHFWLNILCYGIIY